MIKVEFLKTNSKKVLKIDKDKNIRYIHLYISDISNINDIRHDSVMINISPIYRGNIRSVAHVRVSLIFR